MPKSKTKPKSCMVEVMSRNGRRTFMHRRDLEKRTRKTAGGVRILIDSKFKPLAPEEILFGPGHRDLPRNATMDWSPNKHKEYYKRYK